MPGTAATLTEKQFAEIGRIICEFSYLEWTLQVVFASLITGSAAPGGVGLFMAARIRRIGFLTDILRRAIPPTWTEERKKKFRDLLDDVIKFEDKRDKIAHAAWSGVDGDENVAVGDRRLKAEIESEMVKTVEDFAGLAAQINHAAHELTRVAFFG